MGRQPVTGKLGRARGRSGRLLRRVATLGGVGALGLLAGCSGQAARFGLPEAASAQAPNMANLWVGAWIASLIIGGLVWGLIGWSVIRYRHKEGINSAPRQTKYHLPLELLYTLVPFLIVGVLFFYTVRADDAMKAQSPNPDVVIDVIGQKWSWTFNYNEADNPAIGTDAHEVGTLEKIPDLYLPLNKTVRINLNSPDVIHSFWVPSFYYKLDVVPGHPNSMDVTPTKLGVFDGKCAELCGTYHSLMLFEVHIVTEEEYNEYVKELAASGNAGVKELPTSSEDTLPEYENEGEH
ncbi:cytochrome c oxidase subunit II [Tessaracoccus rhinocerotis]|uniref:cytochrome-c oxidase n=2 Tax=Tessaracoccus rhinocerotis TaxID=1689449 RepID=A0A553K2B6_9ACTN|nr:cytochrome c oxidase subunit II [Tessaracoccus rhinocerotis]